MRRLLDLRSVVIGTLIAAGLTGLALGIAVFGFGNAYYASVFIPFAVLSLLAIAWFMFLREDGFIRRRSGGGSPSDGGSADEPRPSEPLAVSGIGSSGDGPRPLESLASGLDRSMYAPRDGTLVARGLESASGRGDSGARAGSDAKIALVVASVELGLIAAALYAVAGVGARYYL